MGGLYKALGQSYAGRVQPPDAKPVLEKALLKKAEASADVRFEAKAPGKSTPQRVRSSEVPDQKVPYVLASGEGQRLVAGKELFALLGHQRTSIPRRRRLSASTGCSPSSMSWT
ncbi:hypothetical protein [Melittangium boletus]|uniref:Cupin n=1 Tax=Melittangium boletus DSM 14713 TaxID=1294270 RepID=A0A250IL85_9BACT|nr:hypothetical protein [Melittangium boletus]ATB31716.1 cupin [Melittangium boletus DSM 14713]